MCTIDINKTLRRCKNALKKTGSAESVLTKGVIERMDMFVSECEDSEVADAIRECLYCATKIPVDMTGFAKALRKYIKVSGCQKTPKWYYMASTNLKKEKLEFLDNAYLRNVDISLESQSTARQVRRIVEKRVCQTYYKQHKVAQKSNDNSHRSRMRRAVSFQISTLGYLENVPGFRRDKSSHWRKGYDAKLRKVVYRPKQGYDTFEEAQLAAIASGIRHPKEGKMQAYLCEHCGKYHIGHTREESEVIALPLSTANMSSVMTNMAV